MDILRTTKSWMNYWKKRKINWENEYFTPEHPHRDLIINKLRQFSFKSLLEVGCGAGANIYKVKQNFPRVDVGGVDVNSDAIECAKKILPRSTIIQVGEAEDVYISDKGSDILLSDMCYIYLNKKHFRKAIAEARRIARNGVVFCEFHSKSWIKRLWLKIKTGYNAYDYGKELRDAGFTNIEIEKVRVAGPWGENEPQKTFCHLIVAKP